MSVVTLEDAQARLDELIAHLGPNDVIQIVRGDRPVARLVGEPPAAGRPRRPGSAAGRLVIRSDDDDHLRDFAESMR
jgi:antitoxin (DNA-binding transcriptional repressor) of toxin-antitoxin stability system